MIEQATHDTQDSDEHDERRWKREPLDVALCVAKCKATTSECQSWKGSRMPRPFDAQSPAKRTHQMSRHSRNVVQPVPCRNRDRQLDDERNEREERRRDGEQDGDHS